MVRRAAPTSVCCRVAVAGCTVRSPSRSALHIHTDGAYLQVPLIERLVAVLEDALLVGEGGELRELGRWQQQGLGVGMLRRGRRCGSRGARTHAVRWARLRAPGQRMHAPREHGSNCRGSRSQPLVSAPRRVRRSSGLPDKSLRGPSRGGLVCSTGVCGSCWHLSLCHDLGACPRQYAYRATKHSTLPPFSLLVLRRCSLVICM